MEANPSILIFLRMSGHRRSSSVNDDKQKKEEPKDLSLRASQHSPLIDDIKESLGTAIGVGVGVGRGVYGRAVGKGKKLYEDIYSGITSMAASCVKPGDERYPKYNDCKSTRNINEIQSLLCVPLILNSISIKVGPDKGMLETYDEFENRAKTLKQMLKNLQNNPNAFNNENSLAVSDITVEDLKKKIVNLKDVEKKVKKSINIEIIKNERSDSRIYGFTTDTYAKDYVKNEKAGVPNADSYYAESFPNAIFFGVADGIGWGYPSRRAAQSAVLGFMCGLNANFRKRSRGSQLDTTGIAQACYQALQFAHVSVHANTESKTTLAAGMIVELEHQFPNYSISPISNAAPSNESESDSDSLDEDDLIIDSRKLWIFIGISVGDSLIYRFSASRPSVTELTCSDRTGGVRDAGGSLGGPEPDLRNLQYHFALLHEGDLIIAVSDGVHDNLDPEVLHVSPKESGVPNATEKIDWYDIDDNVKNDVKRKYKEKKLCEIIESVGRDKISPRSVTDAVVNFVTTITFPQREAMEKGSRLQCDWNKMSEEERNEKNSQVREALKNPVGKFDHVTCLTLQVGPESGQQIYLS